MQRWLDVASDGNIQVLLDSQLYASVIGSSRLGKLKDYPFYPGPLGRRSFASVARIQEVAHSTIDYQCDLPFTAIVTPAVPVGSFNGVWSGIYMSLLDESFRYFGSRDDGRPLYAALLIEESAFAADQDDLDEFLDDLTSYEVAGYYIVVVRNAVTYPSVISDDCLSSMMYISYVLSVVNDYDVIWGFSDLDGIPLIASGAETIATGWYSNLRQFTYSRWLPADGGRQPRPRYTSVQLMSSLIKDVELQSVFDLGQVMTVIQDDRYDGAFSSKDPALVNWRLQDACLQHWCAVGTLVEDANTGSGISGDLDSLENSIASAAALARVLDGNGIPFGPPAPWSRLGSWADAVARFRSEVGV